MVHVSDMSWTRKINHPSEMLKKGDEVEALAIDIDKNTSAFRSALKQLEDDPWGRKGQLACARAGFGGETLDPGAEEALAKLGGFNAPFPDFSASLRRLAAGELPSIPANFPRELHEILEGITKAIRDQTP
jgi:hypothetical protein